MAQQDCSSELNQTCHFFLVYFPQSRAMVPLTCPNVLVGIRWSEHGLNLVGVRLRFYENADLTELTGPCVAGTRISPSRHHNSTEFNSTQFVVVSCSRSRRVLV
jgi:hypothetical protein